MGVVLLKPGDPEAKGLVERGARYLETSFLPGRHVGSPADFNAQLADWLVRANSRHHRVIGPPPADRIVEDRAAMLPLPPLLPDPAFRKTIRLGRDHTSAFSPATPRFTHAPSATESRCGPISIR